MKINLSGKWKLWLEPKEERAADCFEIEKITAFGETEVKERPECQEDGEISIPGILQAQGYGDDVTKETPWVSGLHDPLWYERGEYQYAQEEGCQVPFLSQPLKHYIGRAWYEREICVEENSEEEWTLFIELTRWKTSVWLDGVYQGGDLSLCASHEISLGKLSSGTHRLTVCVDNRMQYPYRPDGHGVSDALGALWNGMAGEVCLLTASEIEKREQDKKTYAAEHPRMVKVEDGMFWVDGYPEYFRGTHFGGEYPITGYPETDPAWWDRVMGVIKEWGLNFIRCHSCCLPEAAFEAADRAGIYIQIECGMWNVFNEGIEMLDVLRKETQKILRQFGHHPSFVLFSPSNEPSGEWYRPLEHWVSETREFDKSLGYQNRRIYTAQSGWFYDKAPKDVTKEETDYLYFHRSAYGPILGGNIRNIEGWRGKDYLPSVEGATLPIICHEMGQWCAYPDFSIEEKFKGYLQPGNYRVFKENARAKGVLWRNKEFVSCSGKNQVMMYKEDLEANFRTPHLYGFEMLDLHDYLGQGTALVGMLDAFWDNKGYVTPEEFREFCQETVLLARVPKYVYKNTETVQIPVEICHFGKQVLKDKTIQWELVDRETGNVYQTGEWFFEEITAGKNRKIGEIALDFSCVTSHTKMSLHIWMDEIQNHWDLYVFAKPEVSETVHGENDVIEGKNDQAICTRDWSEAKEALQKGKKVVFFPHLSAMDYNCPAVTMRPVFWNAQMGPGWTRNLGLSVETEHPALADFLTEEHGGWVWEDILEQARGFRTDYMPQGWKPVVTVIDEWNRNTPCALVMEGKVGKGSLLLVSACLEGSFEERPAANSLKNSLLKYANSEAFCPEVEILEKDVENCLFSVNLVDCAAATYQFDVDAQVKDADAFSDCNPNKTARIEKSTYPITVTIQLESVQDVKGIAYLPDQKDRMHEGGIHEYKVEVWQNEQWVPVLTDAFENTFMFQRANFDTICKTDKIRITVLSGYGVGSKPCWKDNKEGWYPEKKGHTAVVQAAKLFAVCDTTVEEDDEIFWSGRKKSTTKEIDD